ncbi:Putative Prolyl-tRNA synthetase [Rhizopus microsporus]|nr:Putative Prolyl-tRNA synthetase [Rhizopus microsporus]
MASSDAVLEILSKLSINVDPISHDPVLDTKTWAEKLSNLQTPQYQTTKTLIFKPKTAKTAPVTPVFVIALDSTETNATALGKKLSLKDLRFASEDLLKDTFKTQKGSVSPFALSNVAELNNVHIVVDAAALQTTDLLAFHPATSDKTIFISAQQLKTYLTSLGKEHVEVDFKALAEAKPAPKPAKAAPAKKEAIVNNNEEVNAMGIGCKKDEDFPKWYQQKAGIKSKADLRENYTPGFKFNHWEIRGIPLRIEIGPKDLQKNQVFCARRDTGDKFSISLDNLEQGVKDSLETIQQDMFKRAKQKMDESIVRVSKWEDFVPTLNQKKLLLVPWCNRTECEDDIKDRSARVASEGEEEDERAPSMGAKSLCKPFEQPTEDPIVPGVTKCVACDHDAQHFMLFGRSY